MTASDPIPRNSERETVRLHMQTLIAALKLADKLEASLIEYYKEVIE